MQQNCALYPPALPAQHVIIFRLCAGHKRFTDPRALRLVLAGAPAGKNTQTSGAVQAWKRRWFSGEPSPARRSAGSYEWYASCGAVSIPFCGDDC